jgi:hypothetical protein
MKDSRYTKERIYDLLPSIYRIRDKEQGEPLKALLEIIGEQIGFVEQDIERLYNNWFIETCVEWIVPYIGDLLQAKILNPVTRSTSSHRSWVANTISYRRRKGTLATIEQLSRDVTGWNCKAVEFFQNLITTQYLNHLRFEPTATVDLRNRDLLELIGTPFDRSAHTVDVRHVDSKRGYYNISNIGIFLWRLQAYPVIDAPAFYLGDGKYTFSQLGYDLPIYNHPETETSIDHITTELNVPARIRRIALEKYLEIYETDRNFAYQKSIKIVKSVLGANGKVVESQILPENIAVCNLSKWHHQPPIGKEVAIDPELGRIIFPPESEKKIVNVHVNYYYGFSGDIAGGFYDRKKIEEKKEASSIEELQNDLYYYYKISKKNPEKLFISLSAALEKWKTEKFHDSRDVIFEIIDSEIYTDNDGNRHNNIVPIKIEIPENITMVIKSQNLQRPVFRLNKPISIKGGRRSRIILDGILFILDVDYSDSSTGKLYDNNNIILKIEKGDLSELIINHCTLVPGRTERENHGKLLFSWENIPHIAKDVKRLKKYLFDILHEEWINGNDVVFKKKGPSNSRITVSLSSTVKPPIIPELKLNANDTSTSSGDTIAPITSDTISIKKRVRGEGEYHTIYKLPISKSNGLLNVYSSMYSIAIFGDSADSNTNNTNTNNNTLKILVNRSIIGRIDSSSCDANLRIVDSIVDGKGAIEAIRCTSASIENTTVFGKVSSVILDYASNSIFTDVLDIDRRQQGCVRFCYIPYGSQIPRPYRCILEYESNMMILTSNINQMSDSILSINKENKILRPEHIKPQFTSITYGDDGYGQLHRDVEKMIFEGGDNGSEMGAFNHLYNPQRIKNLSSSINEYLKFGLEAGIFLVT